MFYLPIFFQVRENHKILVWKNPCLYSLPLSKIVYAMIVLSDRLMDVCQEFCSTQILRKRTTVLREISCLVRMLDVLLEDITLLCTGDCVANEKTLVDNYDACRRHFYRIRNHIRRKIEA